MLGFFPDASLAIGEDHRVDLKCLGVCQGHAKCDGVGVGPNGLIENAEAFALLINLHRFDEIQHAISHVFGSIVFLDVLSSEAH